MSVSCSHVLSNNCLTMTVVVAFKRKQRKKEFSCFKMKIAAAILIEHLFESTVIGSSHDLLSNQVSQTTTYNSSHFSGTMVSRQLSRRYTLEIEQRPDCRAQTRSYGSIYLIARRQISFLLPRVGLGVTSTYTTCSAIKRMTSVFVLSNNS